MQNTKYKIRLIVPVKLQYFTFLILHLQMTIQEANQQLLSGLKSIYDPREAVAITDLVMESITKRQKTDRIIQKNFSLAVSEKLLLEKYSAELMNHRPVQYVLHEAWFCGMKLYVDERVLIPRPETEELVSWIIDDISDFKQEVSEINILDVGTGSGCIPIALKKKLSQASIYSCDISQDALDVAQQNASMQKVDINFILSDFLNANNRDLLPTFDLLVSNPPYIPVSNRKNMSEHVVGHEPPAALFVHDNNPLIFYEALADFVVEKSAARTKIFAELHEDFAEEVKQLFFSRRFAAAEIRKDMYGNDRMIKATMLL